MPTQLKYKDIPDTTHYQLIRQKGRCPICHRKVRSPVLDHHHKKRIKGTGFVRGVLCRQCNVLVAKMENNTVRFGSDQRRLPNILRAMADYIESPPMAHLKLIHPTEAEKPKKLQKSSYNKLKKAFFSKPCNKRKFPEYPKSGKLTKYLEILYNIYKMKPEYYK